ncbi:prepilin-type N-terminal cleavage/methylation domain-containing protein [Thermus thermophilus]|uniref:Prepilin-type N-terminal cleavage/methylation domain-containing protein n=1 Tax=Thermus thermophilus JL-18 TaxID=798128 RepID=H9ZQX2_THETH|nr:prepilin-type N-terminal cleavage/methylation domain-containing protein [Thermus thermophilus]AFH38732.1 prepilin-type N-terminal cleavage/methylation domain-containing protein [Thermus thermophilus JL-18]
MRTGFTLIELLVVMALLALLLGLTYVPLTLAREKANLAAGQAYVRNVATRLEALRDPRGKLPTYLTDCMSGFGRRPSAVTECAITYPDPLSYVIEASLEGAAMGKIVYRSEDGTLTSLP